MDTEKLTTRSRDAVSAAVRNALTNGNPNAEPVHLLHALLLVPDNTVAPLLSAIDVDPQVVDAAAQGAIKKLPSSPMRRPAPSSSATPSWPPSICCSPCPPSPRTPDRFSPTWVRPPTS
jgi:ATP-dependent Clp protease ATP-binding subunit ClpA